MKVGCLDKDGTRLVVCREVGEDLFIVNTASGEVTRGSAGGLLERTASRLSPFQSNDEHLRRVVTDSSQDGIVFTYTEGGSTVDVIDVTAGVVHTVHLPRDMAIRAVRTVAPTTLQVTAGSRAAEDVAGDHTTTFLLASQDGGKTPPNQLFELLHSTPGGPNPPAYDFVSHDQAPASLVSLLSPSTAAVARDAPSRVFGSPSTLATVALGYPDALLATDASDVELVDFLRPAKAGASPAAYCPITRTMYNLLPSEGLEDGGEFAGTLEAVSLRQSTVRHVKIPLQRESPGGAKPTASGSISDNSRIHSAVPLPVGRVLTASVGGELRQWEMDQLGLKQSLLSWRQMVGGEEGRLQLERYSGLDAKGPKHGKVDEKNEPHVGGNTWQGGTGGRDTAGLGGKGGPYRLDAGHDVHQLSDEEKEAVPEHIKQVSIRGLGLAR